jgi:acetylornithine aminotransferase
VYYNAPSAALASLLVTLTQREGGLGYPCRTQHPTSVSGAKVFFASSGTEANEGALKVARKVGKDRGGPTKTEIVCFHQSFHGRSFGALSVTSNSKYQDPFAPLVPGVRVGELNQSEGLEDLITENTCAVIVEPIQGEGGVHSADVQWMRELVGRARDTGAVVIFDEIQVSASYNSDEIGPGVCGRQRTPQRHLSNSLDLRGDGGFCSDPDNPLCMLDAGTVLLIICA